MKSIFNYIALVSLAFSFLTTANATSYELNSLQLDNGINSFFLSEVSMAEDEETETECILTDEVSYGPPSSSYLLNTLSHARHYKRSALYIIRAPPTFLFT